MQYGNKSVFYKNAGTTLTILFMIHLFASLRGSPKKQSPPPMSPFQVLLLLVCLVVATAVPRSLQAEGEVSAFMLPLYEAVWTKLFTEAPPSRLFTLAIVHDPSKRTITPPPSEVVDRLLSLKGVKREFFISTEKLQLPDYSLPRKTYDVVPGVTKKGAEDRVDVCIASFIEWSAQDEFAVHWVRSSGPMAGGSGIIVFRHDGHRWQFVRHGDVMEH